ncbi:MAG: PEP-CTERM-box response regulator transcription factor [Gammaproteobacteria bacterium]
MPAEQKTLLIVEDDPGLQSQLKWSFSGFDEVVTAEDRASAIALLRRHEPSVMTLDLGLPPDPDNTTEGFATLEEVLALSPDTKVIVVTGNDDRANALRAVSMGAYDFVEKPVEPEVLNLIADRAYRLHELERENRLLAQRDSESPLDGIIATSPAMLKVCRTVEKVGPTDATVLLLGESGTGKELLARAVHGSSTRSDGPFVAINCAAIPENLLESELFGYEKGAFTGAAKQTKGKIEYADGGTLFLDEVGDLPQPLQSKLLRFLQERVLERVGGRTEIPIDVRVVCATHQNLDGLIASGDFREDLYYRISEITVRIPALREREGDVLVIARSLLERFARQSGSGGNLAFSPSAIKAMDHYRWPGNVRELENRVKRASIMAEGSQIQADDLELEMPDSDESLPFNLRVVRDAAERKALDRALNHVRGNVSQAAELLGITRPTLYALMNKYQLRE